ncbi:MAG: SCO family protein [Actinomycetota bacterium]
MDDAEFLERVSAVTERHAPPDGLVDLLAEDSGVFAGHGAREVARRRGWILAAFEQTGLPEGAVPYVREELETAHDPYVAAAAAKAVRGSAARDGEFAYHLTAALTNMVQRDDAVCFDGFVPNWSVGSTTTVVAEIAASLRWLGRLPAAVVPTIEAAAATVGLGAAARQRLTEVITEAESVAEDDGRVELRHLDTGERSCCRPASPGADPLPTGTGRDLARVRVEDQAGASLSLAAFLTGRPTVIAFFYTRCENPYKCSLTVTKMADLQARLAQIGRGDDVQLAIVSYDSAHDTAARLARYGQARGFVGTDHHRLFRVVDGEEDLHTYLAINVGYAGSLVNRHAVELFLTNDAGVVVRRWERTLWSVDDVLEQVLSPSAP